MRTENGTPCLTCTCNASIPAGAFAASGVQPVRALCRGDIEQFRAASHQGGPLLVGCTQEAAFFEELANREDSPAELRFVNLREYAGWSAEGAQSGPKIAALLAMAAMPAPAPIASIDLESQGSLLIIGPAAVALDWATRLKDELDVAVLATEGAKLPSRRDFPLWDGRGVSVKGHLGAFEVSWRNASPIDLELCTGCGACSRACPEDAIGFGPRFDANRCKDHGDCVKACGPIKAIDFARLDAPPRMESFDLVMDLSRQPLIRLPHLPDGYFAPGADPLEQSEAARLLIGLVGEFQRPRYFHYTESRCAHHRQGKTSCTRCIDVCSTAALTSDGQRIVVDAALCAGCGGCATVCPTGAARHVYPNPSELMAVAREGLRAYRRAGGAEACLLVHSARRRDAILDLGRQGRGLPARVLPFDVHDVAAFGLDQALATICYGADLLRVVVDDEMPEGYRLALQQQFEIGNEILAALGFGAQRLALVDESALATALWTLPPVTPLAAAEFTFPKDKRQALDLALSHLAALVPPREEPIPLSRGAPFGSVTVDTARCTLCMSCTGACPAGALLDTPEEPRLRFTEKNCVQCGLCAQICPEDAIQLTPQLWLHEDAARPRTLNAAEPFHCVSCGKPYGTRQMVDAMLARLGGHSMFADANALRRLQMCSDCRVVDLMRHRDELSVLGEQR